MVGAKIKTNQAYCLELERIVTIDEVWELTFGKNRLNQELTFQCSVEGCGARMIKRSIAGEAMAGLSAAIHGKSTSIQRYPSAKK